MKTKLVIFLLLCMYILTAQTTSQSLTISFDKSVKENRGQYFLSSTNAIGLQDGAYYATVIKISKIALPANATNISVTVSICINSTAINNSAVVRNPGSSFNPEYDPKNIWETIHSGAQLDTIIYGQTKNLNITNQYNSAVGSFCYLSVHRKSGTTYAVVIVNAQISYTIPEPTCSKFKVENNFKAGNVIVDQVNRASGVEITKNHNQNCAVSAIENQSDGTYNYIWNDTESQVNKSNWASLKEGHLTNNINYSFTVTSQTNNNVYTANLRKLCNVTVSANKPNLWVKINGTQYNYPAAVNAIVEGTSVSLEAQEELYDQTNELKHYFQNWSDGNPNRSRSIQINSHTPIQAVYKTYPAFPASKRNASQDNDNNNIGMPVKITWNEHPSSSVTSYEIWRRVKTGSAIKIADVNRGVGYYEDGSYSYGTYQQNFILYYDVRPYYAPDATLAPENCNIMAYGRNIPAPKVSEKDDKAIAAIEEVIETGIDNYPNPFNPATTIRYAIAEGGKVSIKVYDIAGKEVSVLVDEVKEKGRYQVTFDGSKLASGPYFYRMTAPGYAVTKKILLMK